MKIRIHRNQLLWTIFIRDQENVCHEMFAMFFYNIRNYFL